MGLVAAAGARANDGSSRGAGGAAAAGGAGAGSGQLPRGPPLFVHSNHAEPTPDMLQESENPEARRLFRTPNGGYKPVVVMEIDSGTDECLRSVETRFHTAELAMGGPLKKRGPYRLQLSCSQSSNLQVVPRVGSPSLLYE
mgnify:CR=1 FL=1